MVESAMKSDKTPALILSGGSETVSVSIAEELIERRVPLLVVAQGEDSLIRNLPALTAYAKLTWQPEGDELNKLITFHERNGAGQPGLWPAFAHRRRNNSYFF